MLEGQQGRIRSLIQSHSFITRYLGPPKILLCRSLVVKVAHCTAHNRTGTELFLHDACRFVVEAFIIDVLDYHQVGLYASGRRVVFLFMLWPLVLQLCEQIASADHQRGLVYWNYVIAYESHASCC